MKSRRASIDDSSCGFRLEEIEQSIAQRFEEQARKHARRLAIRHRSIELSYGELNQAANRVAYSILDDDTSTAVPAALLCGAAPATIAAALGALKSGRAFAPLDGRAPVARLKEILAGLQSRLILTDRKYAALARRLAGKAVRIIEVVPASGAAARENPQIPVRTDALAYVNFTSGSTGAPKGVMWNHRSELFGIRVKARALGIAPDDRVSLLRAHNVGAVRDMWLALLNGAALIAGDLDDAGLASLGVWLRAEKISVFSCVATVFRQAVRDAKTESAFPAVRLIHIGGEPIFRPDVELYRRYFSGACRFVVRYSISETQAVSYFFIDKRTEIAGDRVPVGYPLPGSKVMILDDTGRPVPAGSSGEIAVRSAYLAAGYWRDEKSTRARFLADPGGGAERTYLTGDLGYLLGDGCLVHIGRKDLQTKIRGHRVEITAVERALHEIAAVRHAAVVSQTDRSGRAKLVAYVAARKNHRPDPARWRARLRARLPAFMVPAQFVVLDSLPVGAGGKIDRRALPAAPRRERQAGQAQLPARSEIEIVVERFWSEALAIAQPGVRDDFAALGGDSLQAAQIVARIHELFPLRRPLVHLPPTIEATARAIVAREREPGQGSRIAAAFLRLEGLSDAEVAVALGSSANDD